MKALRSLDKALKRLWVAGMKARSAIFTEVTEP